MYVGIDISKSKHDVCILDDKGNVIKNAFTILLKHDLPPIELNPLQPGIGFA